MIPSKSWFPSALQDRAAWFDNFATQFALVATGLGFLAADVTAVTNDNAMVQALAGFTPQLEAYKDAVRQFRLVITEGDIGDANPSFPDATSFPDVTAVNTGIFERLVKLVDRIRAAPAYSPETGALLGILPQSVPPPSQNELENMKPAITAGISYGNYTFDVNVTRMGQPMFRVEISRGDSGTWQIVTTADANPCSVTVTPTTAGQPERILVRAQLVNKNKPVGQPSDPTFVTINP